MGGRPPPPGDDSDSDAKAEQKDFKELQAMVAEMGNTATKMGKDGSTVTIRSAHSMFTGWKMQLKPFDFSKNKPAKGHLKELDYLFDTWQKSLKA